MTTARLCLRDDDVSGYTDPSLLAGLRANLWEHRVVTYGVVPRAAADSFGTAWPMFAVGEFAASLMDNPTLVAFLEDEVRRGLAGSLFTV